MRNIFDPSSKMTGVNGGTSKPNVNAASPLVSTHVNPPRQTMAVANLVVAIKGSKFAKV